jgi:uncharacterized protein YbaR (Trm112 family)
MKLTDDQLRLLRCPVTGQPLRQSDDEAWLICDAAGLRYPIIDGIPRLIAAAAEKIEVPS